MGVNKIVALDLDFLCIKGEVKEGEVVPKSASYGHI